MSQINVGVNTQAGVAAMKQLEAAVKAVGGSFDDLTRASATLNAAGQLTRGTIEQLDQSGRKYTSTLAQNKQGLLEFTKTVTDAGNAGKDAGEKILVTWQGLARVFEVQVFRRGVTSVINALRDGTAAAIDYQVRLQQVANVAGQGGEGFDAFAARVRSLSDQFGTGLSATLGAAQTALTSQGGDAAAGFEVLTAAMKLSRATGLELQASAQLTTTTLQAFGLSAEEASRAVNTLFLVSQRSRSSLDEIKVAIGRVGPTAQALGISMEQLSALFLTVSQQGGRPTEAFTLLNQVLGQLQQPTKGMKNFLESLGVSSGQAALQTFGLTGILQRLTEAAEHNPEALGEIAGSLKRLRGELALTGQNVQVFERNLQDIFAGAGRLGAADQLVEETPAQRLITEFNKLKNVLQEDIGGKFIRGVVALSDSMGGARATAQGMTEAITQSAISFGAFKIGAEVIPGLLTQITAKAADTQTGFSSLGQAAASMGNAFTAAYAAGSLLFGIINQLERASVARFRNEEARLSRLSDQQAERNRDEGRALIEANRDRVDRAFQPQLQAAAQRRALSVEARELELSNQRAIQAEFRVSAQTYLDSMRRSISDIRQDLSRINTEMQQSRRNQSTFAQNIEASGFQRRLGIEQDPTAALEMLRTRYQRVRDDAQRILSTPGATPDQIQHANQLFAEAARLSDEMAQRESTIQQRQNLINGNLQRRVVLGQEVLINAVSFADADARGLDLIRRRNEAEIAHRDNLKATQAEQQRALANQLQGQRALESNLRQAEQFRVINDQGQLLPQFRAAERRGDAQGRTGAGGREALREFDRIAAEAMRLAQEQGGDTEALNSLLQVRRSNLLAQVGMLEDTNRLERERLNIVEQQNIAQQQQASAQTGINTRAAEIQQLARQFARPSPTINLEGQPAVVPGAGLRGRSPARQAELEDTARRVNELTTAINTLNRAEATLETTGGQTAANLDALAAAMADARAKAEGLRNVSGGTADLLGLQSPGGRFTFQQQLTNFLQTTRPDQQEGALDVMRDLIRRNENAKQFIDGLNRQMQGANPLQQLPVQFQNAGAAAQGAQGAMVGALQAAGQEAGNLNEQLANVQQAFGNLSEVSFTGADQGQAGFAASGGIARGFPGAPRGTDTVPYWLTPGEYIMDAKNTGKYYTQLVAMSHGVHPGYAAKGGVVVGDIHVTANMNSVNEKSVRQLGRAISREIKRGTISFGQ